MANGSTKNSSRLKCLNRHRIPSPRATLKKGKLPMNQKMGKLSLHQESLRNLTLIGTRVPAQIMSQHDTCLCAPTQQN